MSEPTSQEPSAADRPTEPPHDATASHERRQSGFDSRGKVRRTRAGVLWVSFIAAAILLIALLIFIAQNSQPVQIDFFGFNGEISLAVALLLSAVIGMLLVAIPGSARIFQLRHALKKNAH